MGQKNGVDGVGQINGVGGVGGFVGQKMAWIAYVEVLAWVAAWVHKIGVGRHFGVGDVVVRMAWVYKIFFKFLSFFFSITTTKTYSSFNS